MEKILSGMKAFINDEEGVTAIEYALLAALVALVMAVGATVLGTNLSGLFNRIGVALSGYNVPGSGS